MILAVPRPRTLGAPQRPSSKVSAVIHTASGNKQAPRELVVHPASLDGPFSTDGGHSATGSQMRLPPANFETIPKGFSVVGIVLFFVTVFRTQRITATVSKVACFCPLRPRNRWLGATSAETRLGAGARDIWHRSIVH